MNDVQILALSLPGQSPKESLVRIITDDWPDNYAVWDRDHLWWVRRHMTRDEAWEWLKAHKLPDTLGKRDAKKAT